MRCDGLKYTILSAAVNNPTYVDDEIYPDWAMLKLFRYFPGQGIGTGVEPHYHDWDEIWLFIDGHGEVSLDGRVPPITPGSVVYTPKGPVHRFQMFTDFGNAALRSRLEGQKRPIHIIESVHGPAIRTVKGFVIQGDENAGSFPDRGSRCPLTELRVVSRPDGFRSGRAVLEVTEYWLAIDGGMRVAVDDVTVLLDSGDLAILGPGASRETSADASVLYGYARE